jgi:hypothetical protein
MGWVEGAGCGEMLASDILSRSVDWGFLTITLMFKGSLQRRDRLCNVRLLRRHCGDCGWRFAPRRMCAGASGLRYLSSFRAIVAQTSNCASS